METPASMRRITRSQAKAAPTSSASKTGRSNAGKVTRNRRALKDVTNESPISGLADSVCNMTTPVSKLFPKDHVSPSPTAIGTPACENAIGTPAGEDILRSQVQSLLEKISADKSTPLPPVSRNLSQMCGFVPSPSALLAPTPVNTPAGWPFMSATPDHIASSPTAVPLSVEGCENFQAENMPCVSEQLVVQSEIKQEQQELVQATENELELSYNASHEEHVLQEIKVDYQTDNAALAEEQEPITRSLSFESPVSAPTSAKKLAISCAIQCPMRELEDDEASNWSLLVNVSSPAHHPHESSDQNDDNGNVNPILDTRDATIKPSNECEEEEELNPMLWEQRSNNGSIHEETLIDDEHKPEEDGEEEEEAGEFCDHYSSCESKDYNDEEDNEYDEEEEEFREDEYDEDDACDELCEGVSKMRIGGGEGDVLLRGVPAFTGKHIRFHYNSDDELEEAEEALQSHAEAEAQEPTRSPGVIKLKGLPTPLGKHLRFKEDHINTPGKH